MPKFYYYSHIGLLVPCGKASRHRGLSISVTNRIASFPHEDNRMLATQSLFLYPKEVAMSKFKIISSPNSAEVEQQVNDLLENGYRLHGSLAFDGICYVQALVKD